MFVPVCDRPSVAEPTEAQDRAVMETKSATIHRKMPMPARQLPITGSAHKAGVVGDSEVAAVIAAIDVAAQRRRAAVLDRRHHLQLVEAQMPGLGETVAGPMARKISATSSEEVRTKPQPSVAVGSGANIPSLSSGLVTARTVRVATLV